MLYLVCNYDEPAAIFDSLEKAKAFCMKRQCPQDFTISTMEVNKEEYDDIYFWYYASDTNTWEICE